MKNRYNPFNVSKFKCDRFCGDCCKRLIVNLTKEDIKKIRQVGYKDEDFLIKEMIGTDKGKPVLLRNKNWCVFLERKKDKKYYCKINAVKPEICSRYPFNFPKLEDCRPSRWMDYKKFLNRRTLIK